MACIREEGSNGDREMAGAFYAADFDVWDVSMGDLAEGRIKLDAFRGVAFTGGFSFADVFGSAKGWGAGVKLNKLVSEEFSRFKARPDTFSLGVCNGCQLMALLGWVPGSGVKAESSQPRFVHNASGRFESRWTMVRIEGKTPSIFLQGMGGSVLGVWVAHGEGQVIFPDNAVLDYVEQRGLAPIRYVNDDAQPTQEYPYNPNGSRNAIASLCSEDGRHLP
jgi:phosphoribosylformylglycinamidine synthase